jgi:hypothetical protein
MTSNQIAEALAAPFEARDVRWKPKVVSNSRCLPVAYLDARVIMERLDAVLGLGGWQDEYQVLTDGSVLCRLSIRVDGEWITKCDVGGQSKQPDVGDRTKSAVSNALKRAAVKFGIGRYLYRLPSVWIGFDEIKKRMIGQPTLPAWALPPDPATNLRRWMKAGQVRYADCMEYLELPPNTPFPDLTPGQLEQIEEYCRTRKPVTTATEE